MLGSSKYEKTVIPEDFLMWIFNYLHQEELHLAV